MLSISLHYLKPKMKSCSFRAHREQSYSLSLMLSEFVVSAGKHGARLDWNGFATINLKSRGEGESPNFMPPAFHCSWVSSILSSLWTQGELCRDGTESGLSCIVQIQMILKFRAVWIQVFDLMPIEREWNFQKPWPNFAPIEGHDATPMDFNGSRVRAPLSQNHRIRTRSRLEAKRPPS